MIHKFHSVSLYDQPFSRYRQFWDKRTEWHQSNLEPHRVKLPYICITSVRDYQILVRFALWPALFEIQARQVHRMTPNWSWILQCQITLYYITTVPECQISLRFALWPAVLELQAILRHVHRITSKLPWTLLGQRYTTYVLLVSPTPKFCFVLLYEQRFPWYSTFYNSPLTTMLNAPKKNKKNCKKKSKTEISQFFIQLW